MNKDKPILIAAGHINHGTLERIIKEHPDVIVVTDFKDIDELKGQLTDHVPEPIKIEASPLVELLDTPYVAYDRNGKVLSARAQRRKKQREERKKLKKQKPGRI